MAVPKRKTSKSRSRKRRTHQKVAVPTLAVCPECDEAKLPHAACPACGMYRGRNVLVQDIEDEE
ncbi:50S ribosomal protein L32 [Desulfamplus magnetovallimortis]|uniref:Large ribosomal subunit protein bL32 n=1 Tax=Desulfamplus magnetovallimortis TaxID=1246637 RepID=A0A1W1HAA0_9BACT|nr:50S ribosomal protein L32 [Desulfamplus magnetovallimortis]SLM29298.1 50S ribosomal protein L32 [Desulfamplus magnetovallimortis]